MYVGKWACTSGCLCSAYGEGEEMHKKGSIKVDLGRIALKIDFNFFIS